MVRITRAFNPRKKELLTAKMCAEFDRLGLDRNWLQCVVEVEGLEFGRSVLSERPKESQLIRQVESEVMEQLGFGTMAFTKESLSQGVDRAIECFFGDWWKEFDEDAIHLDKTRPD